MSDEIYTGFKITEKKKFNADCVPVAFVSSGYHKGSYIVMVKGDKGKSKISVDGELIPVEQKGYQDRITAFVTGPSGAGKSTMAAKIAKQYKKMHPSNPIVLISPKEQDEVLDRLNPIRIRLSDENWFGDEALNLDELESSLCIFDDTEGLTNDKDMMGKIHGLRDKILTLGRSKKVSCICILHQTTNRKETAIPIIESQYITFFPRSPSYQINRLLKEYMGIDKKTMEMLKKLPSRAVTLHKMMPLFYISRDEVGFIDITDI